MLDNQEGRKDSVAREAARRSPELGELTSVTPQRQTSDGGATVVEGPPDAAGTAPLPIQRDGPDWITVVKAFAAFSILSFAVFLVAALFSEQISHFIRDWVFSEEQFWDKTHERGWGLLVGAGLGFFILLFVIAADIAKELVVDELKKF